MTFPEDFALKNQLGRSGVEVPNDFLNTEMKALGELLARFESGMSDLRSTRQGPHCLHETQLLPPLAEGTGEKERSSSVTAKRKNSCNTRHR
jgi:hypothetical protein